MPKLLHPEQLQITEELSMKILTSDIKILKHLFKELQQEKNHGFTSTILKAKDNQGSDCAKRQKWSSQSKNRPVERRSCNRILGYSGHFSCWLSEDPKNYNIYVIKEWFENGSQSFSTKISGKV